MVSRRRKNESVPFIRATDQFIWIIDWVRQTMFVSESLCTSAPRTCCNMVDRESNCSSSGDMEPNDSSLSDYSKPTFVHHVTAHCRVKYSLDRSIGKLTTVPVSNAISAPSAHSSDRAPSVVV